MHEFLTSIQPYLVDLAVATAIALLGTATAAVVKLCQFISDRIGASKFKRAKSLAKGVWLLIQKDHPNWDPMVKIAEMESQLLSKYPSLTQVELNAINKEIHTLMKSLYPDPAPTEPKTIEPASTEETEFIAEPTPTEG